MLLAGGLSTRLYPLTKTVPKPLVPVAGVPNAIHLIKYLKSYGCSEIAINVHYLAEAIVDTLGDGSAFGVRLEYLHEPVLMGSAGALKPMQAFFGGETFAVVGCDDLTDLPLDELVAMHEARGAVATIGLVTRDQVDQYGVVVTEPDGRITGFQEKPEPGTERSKLVNTGIYVFSPQIFDRIPAGTFYDFGKQVFPELLADRVPFYGFDARGAYWCDIGTPREYRRASSDVVNGAFRIPQTRANGADPSAIIAPSAAIDRNVWIGANVRIGEDVRIAGPSVIGDGTVVEEGAALEASIVWENSRIGTGAQLRDAIVGKETEVARGSRLSGEIVASCQPVESA
ncbi:MAG TPA: NDP-sugar synthase [Candidatus Acidoferrales bacterium]|nr:NDP-sugar synthase [Candidatus Acidoferrales bacterium]